MSPADLLADLIAGSPPVAIEALAAGLETDRLQLSSSSVGIAQQRGISSDSAARAAEAFRHLAGEITRESVVIALRAGNRLRAAERLARPDIEVAWTGPTAAGPPIRGNADIVTEMLEGVRDTGEVLLIGYALTADKGSLMEGVISLLVDASRRRSTVTVAFHQDEEKANRENLLKVWDAFVKKPRIFTWDPPKEHPYTKLHAKCLVVDRLDLLVTSANFTFHGLESNLELGLRVRGPQAAVVSERFDHLIAAGVLRQWT